MVSYEFLVFNFSYFAIFLLMMGTGFFGIFPPSKITYVIAGYFISQGSLNLLLVIFSGTIGHTIGNWFQYELARKKGISVLEKFHFFSKKEIHNFMKVFNKNQKWYMFFGKITDPTKVFISLCAGISKMNRVIFLFFATIGSLIWAIGFTALGFYFGESYETYGPLVGLVILGGGALVMLFFYKALKKVSTKN